MLEGYFSNKQTNIFSKERTNRQVLNVIIVQSVWLINVLSKLIFWKTGPFERTVKNKPVRKNGIHNKKMNFERTLFDQTTLSHFVWSYWLCIIFITLFFIIFYYVWTLEPTIHNWSIFAYCSQSSNCLKIVLIQTKKAVKINLKIIVFKANFLIT